ncbi:hypothetical protein V1514DRAFT_322612, partial [Lipomyces japonicus]|uniref:uncharacterized protein n=1 Tax=Lipomyces japonicus TaxID=56871 RepID=UPI0034CD5C8B
MDPSSATAARPSGRMSPMDANGGSLPGPMSYAQAASSSPASGGGKPRITRLPLRARMTDTVIYENLPLEVSDEALIQSFFETFSFGCNFSPLTSGGHHMAFEVRSAANVSNILANPLPIAAASISLTARRL